MKLFITGATGYIGKRLSDIAISGGHQVIAGSRKPPNAENGWIYFDLRSGAPVELPIDIDAVIHLAAYTAPLSIKECDQEVSAATLLQQSAKASSARFIFISSQTARADAPTLYGRTKWRVEDAIRSEAWIIRPGQVYGGVPSGLFGALVSYTGRIRVLPAFIPSPRIQPIHVDDLVEGILRVAGLTDKNPKMLCLGTTDPFSFNRFMRMIAKKRIRRWRLFVPAPVIFLKFALRCIGKKNSERLGLGRLISLFQLNSMKTSSDLELLDLKLRSVETGLHPSGSDRRRGLLLEARAFMSSLIKAPPPSSLMRRYVRAIEAVRNGRPLALPQIFLRFPRLLALLDMRPADDEAELIWRLDSAMALLEATRAGAPYFLGAPGQGNALRNGLLIVWSLFCDTLWRFPRLVFRPLSARIVASAQDFDDSGL